MRLDNSQIVRERDPRASRDLLFFFLLVAFLVAGAGLYAWPHLELRTTGIETERMQRERERLKEENRKLRLEKAALEDLSRVERIAEKQVGLTRPAAEDVYVVEAPRTPPDGSQLAEQGSPAADGTRN
ncbi:MAG TPA: cell division protein FtsL [Vicinamibacteria bacterium]|nr:cell division protein FtsL [Vicinamibacteria bacterium]